MGHSTRLYIENYLNVKVEKYYSYFGSRFLFVNHSKGLKLSSEKCITFPTTENGLKETCNLLSTFRVPTAQTGSLEEFSRLIDVVFLCVFKLKNEITDETILFRLTNRSIRKWLMDGISNEYYNLLFKTDYMFNRDSYVVKTIFDCVIFINQTNSLGLQYCWGKKNPCKLHRRYN